MTTRSYRARNAAYARWHREPVLSQEQQSRLTAKGQSARRVDVNGNPLSEVQQESTQPVRSSFTPFSWETK